MSDAATRLARRWAGRERFVVLDPDFGDGCRFLASWQAWRGDPARCRQLVVVALSPDGAAPVGAGPLAAALRHAWPPPTPNLHPLDFEGGQVRLLLGVGDAQRLLRELVLQADHVWLAHDAAALPLKTVARLMADGACAVTAQDTPAVADAMSSAGFVRAGDGTAGATHWQPHTRPPRGSPLPQRRALVVGAGLAGAFSARALSDEGWSVQVLDRHPAPAAEASGNAAGLFHGTVHADDGPHARLFRAASLLAQRCIAVASASGGVPGSASGLLRLADDLVTMQSVAAALQLSPDWAQPLDRDAASARAGVPLHGPAWFYPGGGWVDPGALVAHTLAGLPFSGGADVQALRHEGGQWQALGADGRVLAAAPVLVLAAAHGVAALLRSASLQADTDWPLQRQRGQVSGWRGGGTVLKLPVAGGAYAIPLPDGLLCGATHDTGEGTEPDDAAHRLNHARLQALCGLQPPADRSRWFGRVGWRLLAADRLPLVGAVASRPQPGRPVATQLRQLPRIEGLFLCTALGGRGITLAPLMGRLVAALVAGSPLPLERRLADAVDPGRWAVRAARRSPC